MSASPAPERPDPAGERRRRILDAAERCFVQSGFHRTTMQDVAAEAGMSPGNLYRYFPSKDAIVAGLAERDRGDIAVDFAALPPGADLVGAFVALARRHLVEATPAKAVLCIEMWAEASRNPAMAAICREFEREMRGRIAGIFRAAGGDRPEDLAQLVMVLADGIIARRALIPDFDPGPILDAMSRIIDAALSGRFDPTGAAALTEDRP